MVKHDIVRRTFTLTHVEDEMLDTIVKSRHPTDFRIESQTVRELIREEFERIQRMLQQPHKGKR